MARKEYDTYVLVDPATVPEDQEMEVILRDLNPEDRRNKYRSFFAKVKISKSDSKYPNLLQVRLGRGQLQEKRWSVEVLQVVDKFAQGAAA